MTKHRSNHLARLIRQGKATAKQEAEFDRLDSAEHAAYRAANPVKRIRAWWDLPIAARMWEADGRDTRA